MNHPNFNLGEMLRLHNVFPEILPALQHCAGRKHRTPNYQPAAVHAPFSTARQ